MSADDTRKIRELYRNAHKLLAISPSSGKNQQAPSNDRPPQRDQAAQFAPESNEDGTSLPAKTASHHRHRRHHHHHHGHTDNHVGTDPNYPLDVAIRRHAAGTTDPRWHGRYMGKSLMELSTSPTHDVNVIVKDDPHMHHHHSGPVHPIHYLSDPLHPIHYHPDLVHPLHDHFHDHRSISPLRIMEARKHVRPPSPDPYPVIRPTRRETHIYHAPNIRTRMADLLPPAPVRTEYVTTQSYVEPAQRYRSARVLIDEPQSFHPVLSARLAPQIVVQNPAPVVLPYVAPLPGMTTRETENYHMSNSQPMMVAQDPSKRTIVYRQ